MKVMKYEKEITLFNSYFDVNDNLNLKSILSIFQDIASIHAKEIGVGYEEMVEKNLYWILSRVKFDIIRQPKIDEDVLAITWPHVKGRVDFDRDYLIKSNDEILIKGTSKWCVIDCNTRMLQRTSNVNYIGEHCLDVNYEDKFNKIDFNEECIEYKFDYVVRFSDLDHNQHMNNTNYANIVLNALDNKEVKHFEINFINECCLNDVIKVYHYKNNDEEIVLGKIEEKNVFVALKK